MKRILIPLTLALSLNGTAQAQANYFLNMLDFEAIDAFMSCTNLDDKDKMKSCLFDGKPAAEGISNQGACDRVLWNHSISIGGELAPEQKSYYDFIKAASSVALRFCRSASLLLDAGAFPTVRNVAKYNFCSPETEEIERAIEMAEASAKADTEMAEAASEIRGLLEGLNSAADQLDQAVCERAESGVLKIPQPER